jgi:hypothetical protein
MKPYSVKDQSLVLTVNGDILFEAKRQFLSDGSKLKFGKRNRGKRAATVGRSVHVRFLHLICISDLSWFIYSVE